MARRAKLSVVGVELTCPHCGGGIAAPNGSYLWTVGELRQARSRNVACDECGSLYEVPSLAQSARIML